MSPLPETDGRTDVRDQNATEVLLGALPHLDAGARVLVIDDNTDRVEQALAERGLEVASWRRVAEIGRGAQAWPPDGPFDAATLRLPRAKDAFEMSLHAAAARLSPGAPVYVYGANDEGIKSAPRRISEVFGDAEPRDARRHCRVIEARRADPPPTPLRGALEDWRRTERFDLPEGPLELVVYPGIFAKGTLDEATALLLGAIPDPPDGAHVLDFGCGSGIISAALKRRVPSLHVQMIDADAVAVHAARQNVPGALALCGASWSSLPAYQRYDRIVTNPPIHRGKERDYTVLRRLIEGAPARLVEEGELWIVTQGQVHLHDILQEQFIEVEEPARTSRFRVWRAARPF